MQIIFLLDCLGAFYLVRTHLGWVGGIKLPIHFHCVLHAKRGGWVQIACKIAYVLNGRPPIGMRDWNVHV